MKAAREFQLMYFQFFTTIPLLVSIISTLQSISGNEF